MYDRVVATQDLSISNFSDDWNIFASSGNDKVSFNPGASNNYYENGQWSSDHRYFDGKIFADLKNGNDILSLSYVSSNYKIDLRGGNGNDLLTAYLGSATFPTFPGDIGIEDNNAILDIKIFGDAGNDQIAVALASVYTQSFGEGLEIYEISYSGNILLDGGPGNDVIQGSFYSERIIGGSGADLIRPSSSITPKVFGPLVGANSFDNEIDLVTGGSGSDVFVAAQYSFLSYRQNGNSDYLHITDFSTGDRVRFEGTALSLQDFVFSTFTTSDGIKGFGMFSDEDSSGRFSSGDDLIVFFAGLTKAPLSNVFQFL